MTKPQGGFSMTMTMDVVGDNPEWDEGPLYFTVEICGVTHGLFIQLDGGNPYEAACGLPISGMDTHSIRAHHLKSYMEDEDFCDMCYDVMALQALADV